MATDLEKFLDFSERIGSLYLECLSDDNEFDSIVGYARDNDVEEEAVQEAIASAAASLVLQGYNSINEDVMVPAFGTAVMNMHVRAAGLTALVQIRGESEKTIAGLKEQVKSLTEQLMTIKADHLAPTNLTRRLEGLAAELEELKKLAKTEQQAPGAVVETPADAPVSTIRIVAKG